MGSLMKNPQVKLNLPFIEYYEVKNKKDELQSERKLVQTKVCLNIVE